MAEELTEEQKKIEEQKKHDETCTDIAKRIESKVDAIYKKLELICDGSFAGLFAIAGAQANGGQWLYAIGFAVLGVLLAFVRNILTSLKYNLPDGDISKFLQGKSAWEAVQEGTRIIFRR